MKHRSKTQRELARQWGVDERTIRNWEGLGAPLADDDEMREWIEDRRSGTRYDNGDTGSAEFVDINPLRVMVEMAGADFLRHAMEHAADALVNVLENEKGLSRHDANGIVLYLHAALTEARNQWTANATYEPTMEAFTGTSVDGFFKRLMPAARRQSRPTNFGSVIQPGPKLTAIYKANGAERLLKGPWVVTGLDEDYSE